MRQLQLIAGVVLMVISMLLWAAAAIDLAFLAWDGIGMYGDPVRDWSATVAEYALGYMLGKAGMYFTKEG